VVSEGQNLATVAPDGGLKIVAQFQPGAAEGRVRPGQHAELALEGYPWTRFGRLDAVVRSVASDLRDGRIRVELDVIDTDHARRLLKHGLPGAVDVAVERASPLDIVLRTLGRGHD
jgi:membrane fusion protein (multidrug efflux system)